MPVTPPKPYPWLTSAVREAAVTTREKLQAQAVRCTMAHNAAGYNIAALAIGDFADALIAVLEQQTPPDARADEPVVSLCRCTTTSIYTHPDGFEEVITLKNPWCPVHGCKCDPPKPEVNAGPRHTEGACPMWSAGACTCTETMGEHCLEHRR